MATIRDHAERRMILIMRSCSFKRSQLCQSSLLRGEVGLEVDACRLVVARVDQSFLRFGLLVGQNRKTFQDYAEYANRQLTAEAPLRGAS
jgi:hypothetical protein